MIVNNATEKLSLFELSEKGGEYRFEKEGEEAVSYTHLDVYKRQQ